MSRIARSRGVDPFYEFAVLGMTASGYGAVITSGAVEPLVAAPAGLALLLRLGLLLGYLDFTLPATLLNVVTLAVAGFYPLDYVYFSRSFLPASHNLVLLLTAVYLLKLRTPRDYFFLQVIAFLELMAATVLSSSLLFFVFLIAFLVFTVGAFTAGEIRRASRHKRVVLRHAIGRRLGVLTGLATAAIVVLTAALFFVLPRTARAALERFAPAGQRIVGFASEVSLGQLGPLTRSQMPVLRIRVPNGERVDGWRWRGNALTEFDGTRWYNHASEPERMTPPVNGWLQVARTEQLARRDGRRIEYEVLQQRAAGTQLFLGGRPEYVFIPAPVLNRTPQDSFVLPFPAPDALRYKVSTFVEPATPPPPGVVPRLTPDERNFHLRLPPHDLRILQLAQQITMGLHTDHERALALENWLRTKYRYSLEPLKREVEDPLAHFLFERREGHCEYFASAMAVMLREVWIPSRVATGFAGGTYNPLAGWYVVHAAEAHSWVEAWIPGRGWTMFDPTPPDLSPPPVTLWTKVQMYLDAADTFWQNWVLGYDLERQLTLAFQVDEQRRGWRWRGLSRALDSGTQWASAGWDAVKRRWALAAAAALTVVLMAFLWPALVRLAHRLASRRRAERGQALSSDASLFYAQLLETLKKRGLEKPPWMTPREFAQGIAPGETARLVNEFTDAYNDLRFGARAEKAAELTRLLAALRA